MGGTWTHRYTTGADASSAASVNGSQGVLTITTGNSLRILPSYLGPSSGGDYDIRATVRADRTSGAYLLVLGRVVDQNNFYAVQLGLSNNTFTVRKNVNGLWATLGTGPTPSPAFAANTDYNVRFQLSGTNLKAKWWLKGNTEPGLWAVEVSDAPYLAGQVGVGAVLTTSRATGTYTFDDFLASPGSASAAPLQVVWAHIWNWLTCLR